MTIHWRFIQTPPASGAYNMAVDEVFLYSASQKTTSPTLRLYSWQVPTLSLGYAQKAADVDLDALNERGWQLVRRPTGGKAILHTDELTYSITASSDEPLVSGSLLESYQRISHTLQKALELLGVATFANNQYNLPAGITKNDPVCFKAPSNFEITWNGKKLIGSAQARKLGGVLQHGSLPLYGDLTRINQVLDYETLNDRETASQKLLDHAVTLEGATGRIIPWEACSQAIIDAFSSDCGIDFIPTQISEDEERMAAELMESKYGTQAWNFRL